MNLDYIRYRILTNEFPSRSAFVLAKRRGNIFFTGFGISQIAYVNKVNILSSPIKYTVDFDNKIFTAIYIQDLSSKLYKYIQEVIDFEDPFAYLQES